jgi:hypothetical protein
MIILPAHRHLLHLIIKKKGDNELGKLVVICYTWEKKQKNDNEPGRFAVICIVPIYKLYKHTQKIPTNVTRVVPFGQKPI